MAEGKPKRERKKPDASPTPPRKGHQGGGLLRTGGNEGNVNGAGRKPADVRASILQTVGDATGLMRDILDGSFRQEVRDPFGVVVGDRPATIQEIATVYKVLAAHALPVRQEVTGRDGGALQVESVALDHAKILDGLDDEGLELARRLAEKVHVRSDS